jgi:hypothetical protein
MSKFIDFAVISFCVLAIIDLGAEGKGLLGEYIVAAACGASIYECALSLVKGLSKT